MSGDLLSIKDFLIVAGGAYCAAGIIENAAAYNATKFFGRKKTAC
jgi:hypothetical protein